MQIQNMCFTYYATQQVIKIPLTHTHTHKHIFKHILHVHTHTQRVHVPHTNSNCHLIIQYKCLVHHSIGMIGTQIYNERVK